MDGSVEGWLVECNQTLEGQIDVRRISTPIKPELAANGVSKSSMEWVSNWKGKVLIKEPMSVLN